MAGAEATSLQESCTLMKNRSKPEFTSRRKSCRGGGKKKSISPRQETPSFWSDYICIFKIFSFSFWLYTSLMSLKSLPLMLYAKQNH